MPDIGEEPRWLDSDQQTAWRALVLGTTLLFDRLDDDLRRHHNISLAEYEILVRLSERDGQMRMAQLADAMAHSRSRITHTIKRMERSDLVERCELTRGRAGRHRPAHRTRRAAAAQRRAHPRRGRARPPGRPRLDEDFQALGRVMDAVADNLIARHPEMEIRHPE